MNRAVQSFLYILCIRIWFLFMIIRSHIRTTRLIFPINLSLLLLWSLFVWILIIRTLIILTSLIIKRSSLIVLRSYNFSILLVITSILWRIRTLITRRLIRPIVRRTRYITRLWTIGI